MPNIVSLQENENESHMRYCHTPTRNVKITNSDPSWQGRGTTEALIHCRGECKMVQPLWEQFDSFL